MKENVSFELWGFKNSNVSELINNYTIFQNNIEKRQIFHPDLKHLKEEINDSL